jgi:hypothetical protein
MWLTMTLLIKPLLRRRRQPNDNASLAHVSACTSTTRFIRAATSGWSTTRHWLHHAAVRTAVHTLVLVSERRRRLAKDADEGELLLLHMPAELWLLFAHFFRRSDWPVGAAAAN